MKLSIFDFRFSIVAAILAAALMASGCATRNAQVHPGAVSTIDSQSYDALLVAQEVISQSKASVEAGTLPASAKPVVNAAIASYNTARDAWLTYRSAAQLNADPQQAAGDLQKAIADLIAAVAAIPKLKGATP